MAVPSTYTEKQLAEFMHNRLGKVAKALKLHLDPGGPGDYAEPVNDALAAYGAEDISTITGVTNIQKLRMLATVAAWQHVVTNFAALYDFSADGSTYNRSQMFAQAKEALQLAEMAALPYSPNYTARITSVDHRQDPYRVFTEDEMAGD